MKAPRVAGRRANGNAVDVKSEGERVTLGPWAKSANERTGALAGGAAT